MYNLKEYEYKINLMTVQKRTKHLESIITDINNRLVNDTELTPMDRARLYSTVTTATKIIHDMQKDAELVLITERLDKLEDK